MATPEATVEVLIQAYQHACYPTPFDSMRGDPQMATLVRGRMSRIGFAPYWREMFRELRDKYNGNPAGFFARNVFIAAETREGPTLLATVATELAGSFGEDVLSAEFDTPLLEEPQSPSRLARFLIHRRAELESSTTPLYPRPRVISSAWIRLAHTLALTDAARHKQLLTEITRKYNRADYESEQAMEEDGWMGGFGIFDRNRQLRAALAQTLARHFPKVVVSQLREPARPSSKLI